MLVRATRARRVLEIGTSNGYSTLWLADAVQSTGGHLESLEIDPARTQLAGDLIARAGLQNVVTLRSTSAAEALRHYEDGTWELVFLGAERSEYVGYWEDLLRVIAPGGTLAVDNALSHAHELTEFNALRSGASPADQLAGPDRRRAAAGGVDWRRYRRDRLTGSPGMSGGARVTPIPRPPYGRAPRRPPLGSGHVDSGGCLDDELRGDGQLGGLLAGQLPFVDPLGATGA